MSWTDVSKKFPIAADTDLGKFITVHLSPSRRMFFEEVSSELYLSKNQAMSHSTNKISRYLYLMLAEVRLGDFTKHEIQGAKKAR